MRNRIAPTKKSKAKTVSLTPDQWRFVESQADKTGSRSRFFQLLVELDRNNNIIVDALKSELDKKLAVKP